jgi:hypothetical protein
MSVIVVVSDNGLKAPVLRTAAHEIAPPVPQRGGAIGYNPTATLGDLLLPTCTEQPEGSLSSVAFSFLARQRRACW